MSTNTTGPSEKLHQLSIDYYVACINLLRSKDVFPRDELWHYTSAEALDSILNTCSLWATNVAYMNDPAEVSYGQKMLSDFLALILESSDTPLKTMFANAAIAALKRQDADPREDYFCICLSEHKDDLSQYRAYSDAGKGYCIGLKIPDLMRFLPRGNHEDTIFHLVRVEYETERQLSSLRELFDLAMVSLTNCEPKLLDGLVENFARWFIEVTLDYVVHFKQKTYRAEGEWRIVPLLMAPEFRDIFDRFRRTRIKDGIFVPYLELGISNDEGELAISKILIGPKLDSERAEFGIRQRIRSLAALNGAPIEVVPASFRTR